MKAMRLAQESGNEYEYGFLLNNLGVTKLDFGDPESAIKDFESALIIAKKVENPRLELTVLENIGYYYMEVDSFDLAKKQFKEVYELGTHINHYQIAVTSIVNLSGVYRQEKDYQMSDSLTKEGLAMAKRNDMNYLVSLIYINMAQVQLMNNNYSIVNQCLDSAAMYEKYTPINDVRKGIFQIKYQMYKQKGDFETALEFYQKLKQFQDSINENGRLQIISELQLKYDVERKERERVQQQNQYESKIAKGELDNAILQRRLAIGAVVVVLLLAGLIVYYFRSKHRRESQFSSAMVNRLEEERGRIARDLHDGIGQSLIILKNKFNKIESGAEDLSEELNENFSETIEEVRSISRSLIPPELRRFGLVKSVNRMLKDVEVSAGIVVTVEIETLERITLSQAEEIRIYRIIQELTNNTIKHSKASSLKLHVLDSANYYSIIYQDSGVGLGLETLDGNADSVGLRSIQQRVKFLNGTVKFERPAIGFKATLKLKKNT
jgi:signal transduction histidine kinase